MPRASSRGLVALLLIVGSMPAVASRAVPSVAQTSSERLIVTPSGDTTVRVQAIYSNADVTCEAKKRKDLRARYRGRLEILRESDGDVAIIDHVTFDEYLKGLSEVPRSWPIETLEAQVIAARSYALYHLEHPTASGRNLGYDICSTDQCQVYRGVSVEQGAFGEAWIRAVTETRGRALLYHDRAIQAFYHSTSPGKTKRSFPGGTPLPYLSSVAGEDDDAPLAHWTVRIPLAHLGPILDADGDWPGGTITSASLSGDTVRLGGSGHNVTVEKSTFRNALNSQAACVYPDTYPTLGASGRKLPQAVPSIDFTMSTSSAAVVLTGRGWGHGVGMSQYGARSLAERGRTHEQILAYYYAGLRPQQITEPGVIRVLIVEDAALIRLSIEGSATVESSNGSSLAPGDRFEVAGGDTLDVRRGVGPSLTPVLTVDVTTGPATITPDGTIAFAYSLSGSAKVTMIVRRGTSEILRTGELSQTAGPNVLSVPLAQPTSSPSPSGTAPSPSPAPTVAPSVTPTATTTAAITPIPTPLQPGNYEIILEAYDGLDRVRTSPVGLTVQAPPTAAQSVPASDEGGTRGVVIGLAVLMLAIGGGWLTFVARRKRAGG